MQQLRTYLVEGEKKRASIIICPGGGYGIISRREAEPVAKAFNNKGYHAFVLNYSLAPTTYYKPLFDLAEAIKYLKENAENLRVDRDKIVICGFSAGGHLAGALGALWHEDFLANHFKEKSECFKPRALILGYPIVTAGDFKAKGAFKNLFGRTTDEIQHNKLSLEKLVGEKMPPTFLWHTIEDSTVLVENSLLLANALRNNNVPFELHLYPYGPHGLSLGTKETYDGRKEYLNEHTGKWFETSIEWLDIMIN